MPSSRPAATCSAAKTSVLDNFSPCTCNQLHLSILECCHEQSTTYIRMPSSRSAAASRAAETSVLNCLSPCSAQQLC